MAPALKMKANGSGTTAGVRRVIAESCAACWSTTVSPPAIVSPLYTSAPNAVRTGGFRRGSPQSRTTFGSVTVFGRFSPAHRPSGN